MFVFLIILIVLIVLFFVAQPLPDLLLLKLKYGSKAKLRYFPVWGIFFYMKHSLTNQNDPFKLFTKIFQEEPQVEIIITNLQFKPLLLMLRPQMYKQFLINYQNFQKFKLIPDVRMGKKGMLIGNGDLWKRQKLLLGSHFRFEELIKRIPLMNNVMKDKLSNLKLEDDIFPSLQYTSSITGDMVLRSFFGEEIAQQKFKGQEQAVVVNQIFNNMGILMKGSPFFYLKWAILGDEWCWRIFSTKKEKEIYDFNTEAKEHMTEIITTRLNQLKRKEREFSNDFIDIYLKAYFEQTAELRPEITMDEMVQQSITLFFAGTETTANLVTTTIYFLSKFPNLQEELYEEITQVLKDEDDVKPEHLSQLRKTTGVLMECLRLKPVVNLLTSRAALKDIYIGDYFIKKGWYVNYMSLANSMNPAFFEKPEEINYNRWTADGKLVDTTIDPYAFIPFSAGPRICIGQHMALLEAKIMMCHTIRKFKFHLNEKISEPKWDYRVTYGLQLEDYVKYSRRQ